MSNASSPDSSNRSQVTAAAEGDVEAFAELVRTYSNAVCSVAYSVLRDYRLAQDVAQETFVKAFTSLRSLQNPEKFGSWIYSIATRFSIDSKRKMTRQVRLGQKLTLEYPLHAAEEESLAANELKLDVHNALDQLDETNRTLMLLFHICEMSMAEIGKLLNLSVSAVESRLRRNRKILRDDYLASWGEMFPSTQSRETFVAQVVKRIVVQAGQHYIPVSDRMRTTEWFVEHFGLTLDRNRHLQLPMGQTLYLIEVSPEVIAARTSSTVPVLVFAVDDAHMVYELLGERGVRVEWEVADRLVGCRFYFFDPDGNKFGIHSQK